MANSTQGLLKAIEGFQGEHQSSPAHKPIVDQLKQVYKDIQKGQSSPDSPGRQAALQAMKDSGQKDFPSESGHDLGWNNVESQKDGATPIAAEVVDAAGGKHGPDDRLTGTAAVRSDSNRLTGVKGSVPPGALAIRQAAAARELGRLGNDNSKSNESVKTPPDAKTTVPTPSTKAGSSANAQRIMAAAGKPMEPQPTQIDQNPFSQKKGNSFAAASAKAKAALVKA